MTWLLYVLIGLAACAVVILGLGFVAYRLSFVRREHRVQLQKPNPAEAPSGSSKSDGKDWLFSHNPEDVRLRSRDGLLLKGYFLPAARPSNKLVVLVHGYTGNGPDEFGAFLPFYHDELNFHVLIPDLRAHGRSEGKYTGFSALEWQDIFDWADAFVQRLGADTQVALHGTSMGAATVMNCNAHNPPDYVKCVVEDCGFTNGYEMTALSAKRDLHLNVPPVIWACALWFRVFTGQSMKKDCDPYGHAARFAKPTLFIHGEADPFVPAEMSVRNHAAATVEKDLLLVKGARHGLSYHTDRAVYEAKLREWYAKWMKETVAA